MQGLRTIKGNRFLSGRLQQILTKPVYRGKIQHNDDIEVEGGHESVVDEELYLTVQGRLKTTREMHPRRRRSKLLLAGIARYRKREKLLRTRYKDENSPYYRCDGNSRVGEDGYPGFGKVDYRLDNVVLGEVREVASSEVIQNMPADETQDMLQDDLAPLRNELGKVQSELQNIGQTFNR